MNLINDIDLVFSGLRRYAHLFDQAANIIHRIVGRRIQFVNVERVAVLEALAGVANTACLALRRQVLAVDGFCKDTGAGRFTDAPRTAEQEGLRKLVVFYSIFQRVGNMLLANNGLERCRAVLAC